MMETKATLEILDGILKEAIESLDKGEKVNGLEYARALVANFERYCAVTRGGENYGKRCFAGWFKK